jgi:hypothetical protein
MSRDGRVVAYWARRNDAYFVRTGDREDPPCEFVTDPAVSADGSTVAYGAFRDGRWHLKAGGGERPLSAEPKGIFLSDDGRRVGWIEYKSLDGGGSAMRVVAEGVAGAYFKIVGRPSFSPVDGTVVYGAEEEGRKIVVIGGKKVETPHRVGDPAFQAGGRRVGYGARIGRNLVWNVIEF